MYGQVTAIVACRHQLTAKAHGAFGLAVPGDELPNLVNQSDRVQVTLALCLPPGKQPVTAQHNTVASGVVLNCLTHHQA